jgi:uncharacterized protein
MDSPLSPDDRQPDSFSPSSHAPGLLPQARMPNQPFLPITDTVLEAAPLPATKPVFCRHCGTALDPNTPGCPICVGAPAAATGSTVVPPSSARTVSSAIWLYFVLLAVTLSVMISSIEAPHAFFVVDAFDTAIVLIWAVACRSVVWPGLNHLGAPKWYALGVWLAACTFCFAELNVHLLHDWLGLGVVKIAPSLRAAGCGWWMVVCVVCIQPAVIEEIAFRGVVLSGLRQSLSTREAVVVSAMLFMTLHLTFPSFPHLFAIGLCLGYIRARSGSLYPCMLMHFIHNLLCTVYADT